MPNGDHSRQRRADAKAERGRRLALAALGLVVFSARFGGQFVVDDVLAIVQNPSIRVLWPPQRALWAPPDLPLAGRPVVNLSFAVNYAISGANPWSYHLVNVATHIANGLLVYVLVAWALRRRVLRGSVSRAARPWLAFVIAALWLVHPLQTEAVAYVSQRTELFFGLFLLLTLWCATRVWGCRPGSAARRGWTAAAIGCCGLGMLSKEVMAGAPILVLLLDRALVAGSWRGAWRRHRALLLGLAATWFVVLAIIASGARRNTVGWQTGVNISWLDYLRTQAGVIIHYLRLCFWPRPLLIAYEWPIVRSFHEAVPAGLAILALLLVSGWALWRNHWSGFLGAWFFVILAPTSSVVPIVTEVVALRRMYMPLLAVVALVVGGVWAALRPGRWAAGGPKEGSAARLRGMATVAAMLAVLGLGLASAARLRMYHDARALWRDALLHYPGSATAQNSLASMALEDGDSAEAVAYLFRSIAIDPRQPGAHAGLGTALLNLGRVSEAMTQFDRAVELNPGMEAGWLGGGLAALRSGDTEQARVRFARAVEVDPGNPQARLWLGRVLAQQNRLREAVTEVSEAVRLDPAEAGIRLELVRLLSQSGQIGPAIAQARELVQRSPDMPEAHRVLGLMLSESGDGAGAVASLRRAVELGDDSPATLAPLAWVLATDPSPAVRRGAEALDLARRAVQRAPTPQPQVLDALAAALAETGQMQEAVRTADQAAALAEGTGAGALAATLRQRADQYRQGKPFHSPAAPASRPASPATGPADPG